MGRLFCCTPSKVMLSRAMLRSSKLRKMGLHDTTSMSGTDGHSLDMLGDKPCARSGVIRAPDAAVRILDVFTLKLTHALTSLYMARVCRYLSLQFVALRMQVDGVLRYTVFLARKIMSRGSLHLMNKP